MDIEALLRTKGLKIKTEEEFIKLIDDINQEIEFDNSLKESDHREKLLDKKYLLERFRLIKAREDAKEFKEKHGCLYCLYYQKPRRCFATRHCPLEEEEIKEVSKKRKTNCPKDKEGDCPYANNVGTCFGFCMVEILKSYKKGEKDG